ncbi:hypothetical protein F5Y05DRAFT_385760 [Hypoxylon sp. FL0543]|nr:hypothetical protein F5Y05DRAFT_385760 [Hypoxylon sp. FL0543]
MHASHSILLGLIALGAALPAPVPNYDIKMEVRSDPDPSIDWKNVLDQIEQAFETTCHNTCMKLFPEEGNNQDYCMEICRESSLYLLWPPPRLN